MVTRLQRMIHWASMLTWMHAVEIMITAQEMCLGFQQNMGTETSDHSLWVTVNVIQSSTTVWNLQKSTQKQQSWLGNFTSTFSELLVWNSMKLEIQQQRSQQNVSSKINEKCFIIWMQRINAASISIVIRLIMIRMFGNWYIASIFDQSTLLKQLIVLVCLELTCFACGHIAPQLRKELETYTFIMIWLILQILFHLSYTTKTLVYWVRFGFISKIISLWLTVHSAVLSPLPLMWRVEVVRVYSA